MEFYLLNFALQTIYLKYTNAQVERHTPLVVPAASMVATQFGFSSVGNPTAK